MPGGPWKPPESRERGQATGCISVPVTTGSPRLLNSPPTNPSRGPSPAQTPTGPERAYRFVWKMPAAMSWSGSAMPGGRNAMTIFGVPRTAGPCTFDCSSGMSSAEKLCHIANARDSNRRATTSICSARRRAATKVPGGMVKVCTRLSRYAGTGMSQATANVPPLPACALPSGSRVLRTCRALGPLRRYPA